MHAVGKAMKEQDYIKGTQSGTVAEFRLVIAVCIGLIGTYYMNQATLGLIGMIVTLHHTPQKVSADCREAHRRG